MRHLLFGLALWLAAGPAQAQEARSVEAFSEACLSDRTSDEQVAAVAERYGATRLDPNPPVGLLSPLIIPDHTQVWMGEDSGTKAASDLYFSSSQGTVLDAPAQGCLVLGFVEGPPVAVDALIERFAGRHMLGKTKSMLLPPYRHWLIEQAGGPAILSVATMGVWGGGHPASLYMALTRIDKRVAEQLRTEL